MKEEKVKAEAARLERPRVGGGMAAAREPSFAARAGLSTTADGGSVGEELVCISDATGEASLPSSLLAACLDALSHQLMYAFADPPRYDRLLLASRRKPSKDKGGRRSRDPASAGVRKKAWRAKSVGAFCKPQVSPRRRPPTAAGTGLKQQLGAKPPEGANEKRRKKVPRRSTGKLAKILHCARCGRHRAGRRV